MIVAGSPSHDHRRNHNSVRNVVIFFSTDQDLWIYDDWIVQLVATVVGNYLSKSTERVECGELMSALTTRHPKDVQTITTGQCAYIAFSPNLHMQRKVKAYSYLLNMTPCSQFIARSIGQHVYKTA